MTIEQSSKTDRKRFSKPLYILAAIVVVLDLGLALFLALYQPTVGIFMFAYISSMVITIVMVIVIYRMREKYSKSERINNNLR